MQDTDTVECDALFKQVNGISRLHDIQKSAANPFSHVITDSKAKIIGYTTGFFPIGHAVRMSKRLKCSLLEHLKCARLMKCLLGIQESLASQLT
jgi:hypothetical protein